MTDIKIMITELHEELELKGHKEGLNQLLFELCEGDIYGDAVVTHLEENYQYKHLEQEGGGEGNGEYCHGVFSLKGVCYRAEYSYYSYNGHDTDCILDTICEVVPEEVLVTVYNVK